MSSKSVGVGILLVLYALAACAAPTTSDRAAVSQPSELQESSHDLLSDVTQQYPSDLYLTGIGKGTSERAAIELARADLLKKVRTEVRVTWTDLILEKNGRGEQEVSRLVETRATELVRGLEIVSQGRDARIGDAYCVVALQKEEVAKIVQAHQGQSDAAPMSGEGSPVRSEGIWVAAEGTIFFQEN